MDQAHKKVILFEPIKAIKDVLETVDGRDLSHKARPKYGYDISHTYGEIDCVMLADFLKTAPFNPKPAGEFIDLGCGIGKAVWVAAAMLNYDRCIGIEKLDLLAKGAEQLREKALQIDLIKSIAERIEFRNDVIESVDISTAHTVFVNGVCFSPSLMATIQDKLGTLRPGAHIITFDKHFTRDDIETLQSEMLPMSWGTKARVYLQRKKLTGEQHV